MMIRNNAFKSLRDDTLSKQVACAVPVEHGGYDNGFISVNKK
jgi:hypothetical protein